MDRWESLTAINGQLGVSIVIVGVVLQEEDVNAAFGVVCQLEARVIGDFEGVAVAVLHPDINRHFVHTGIVHGHPCTKVVSDTAHAKAQIHIGTHSVICAPLELPAQRAVHAQHCITATY